jgi:hypothetical protein
MHVTPGVRGCTAQILIVTPAANFKVKPRSTERGFILSVKKQRGSTDFKNLSSLFASAFRPELSSFYYLLAAGAAKGSGFLCSFAARSDGALDVAQ